MKTSNKKFRITLKLIGENGEIYGAGLPSLEYRAPTAYAAAKKARGWAAVNGVFLLNCDERFVYRVKEAGTPKGEFTDIEL